MSTSWQTDTVIKQIKDVLAWLNAPENNIWLVVFDSIDQGYQDLQDTPDIHDVKHYVPNAEHRSILVTTQLVGLDNSVFQFW